MTPMKATQFEQFAFTHEAFDNLHFQVTVQPEDQSISSPSMEHYDTRTVDVPKNLGVLWVEVFDITSDPNRLGCAQFAGSDEGCVCVTCYLDVPEQSQGLATFLYEVAEHLFGVQCIPHQSDRVVSA